MNGSEDEGGGSPAELMIVMPVYNEQASVRKVVSEWFAEIVNWTENFVFLVINDGSSDGTVAIIERLQEQLGQRLELVTQPNQGHGQSCLNGYRIAAQRRIPFVFQIDSDGQCDPQYFFRFWRLRDKSDVIYGRRVRRDDGWRRVLASAVLKATLRIFAGVSCVDANVPYRLMRTDILEEPLRQTRRVSRWRMWRWRCCCGGKQGCASNRCRSGSGSVTGANRACGLGNSARRRWNWSGRSGNWAREPSGLRKRRGAERAERRGGTGQRRDGWPLSTARG